MSRGVARAYSQERVYELERILSIPAPRDAPATTQSVSVTDDEILILHDDSVIQRLDRMGELRESRLRAGALIHPNDCVRSGAVLWVCDTGEPSPVVKVVDLHALAVVDIIDLQAEGWRIASLDLDGNDGLWCVSVQARPVEARNTILVSYLDLARRELRPEFTVPTDQYYVQGCTEVDGELFIGVNNGDVRDSRILRVDLGRGDIVETILLEDFGESEGLDAKVVDGRLELYTAVVDGLFRLR